MRTLQHTQALLPGWLPPSYSVENNAIMATMMPNIRFTRGLALGASLSTLIGCTGQNAETPHLHWYVFDERSGAFEQAAEYCTRASRGRYQIKLTPLPSDADQHTSGGCNPHANNNVHSHANASKYSHANASKYSHANAGEYGHANACKFGYADTC